MDFAKRLGDLSICWCDVVLVLIFVAQQVIQFNDAETGGLNFLNFLNKFKGL